MQVFSEGQGWAILAAYAVFVFSLTAAITAKKDSLEGFLVAGRNVSALPAGLSIAATWIWAPALFIAAQQAYMNGVAGVFWFTVPNVLCLVIFGFFADRLRRQVPSGFTFSGYMRSVYGHRVQSLYLVQFVGLAVCAFAVQLLAGGAVVSALTGLPFFAVTVVLALTALAYSLWSGIRASVLTDWLQMLIILVVALTIIPWAVSSAGGWHVVAAGAAGINARDGVFDPVVAMTFGVAVSIGLLSGPFGDQSFWQRTFAVCEGQVRKAFFIGAATFAVVPLTLSIPGFLAAGSNLDVATPQLVNVQALLTFLPAWTAIPILVMLLCGLVSTLDSCLCAISSLAAKDMQKRWATSADPLRVAKWSMLLLACAGTAIANIPGLQILYLFLFYGTLRASTLLPTVMTILQIRLEERGVFYGVLFAILIGLPVFAYGNFGGGFQWVIAGSLLTVLSSGVIAVATSVAARR